MTNWGRSGSGDQLGMVNLITPEAIVESAKLVPEGRIYNLSVLLQIAQTGDVLPGTITTPHTRCGKPGCARQADPPRRHGPYWHWIRKVANKTVSNG